VIGKGKNKAITFEQIGGYFFYKTRYEDCDNILAAYI